MVADNIISTSHLNDLEVSRKVAYDVLRKARIKLDMSMMAAFRNYFSSLNAEDVIMHLFVDGSPQKRGLELYAASFDIFIGSADD